MNLEQWVAAHLRRPAAWAVGTVLCVQFVYLGYLAHSEYSGQLRRIERVVETASLGMQQDNRPLIESALIAGLRDSQAAGVSLCRGTDPVLSYRPGSNGDLCRAGGGRLLDWTVRRRAVGLAGFEFVFALDGVKTFGPLAVLSGVTALLLASLLAISTRARRRFQAEVLGPLYDGLNDERVLEIAELESLRRRNQDHHALIRQQAVSVALVELSTQLAHDIRSPLAALESAAADLSALPENQRGLISLAAGRIREIGESLLERQRAAARGGPAPLEEPATPHRLAALIEAVLTEKRLQFRARQDVVMEAAIDAGAAGLMARVQPVEFKRMLSNLLNNAVESIDGRPGSVRLRLASTDRGALMRIEDDGRGIPAAVLANLGGRGASYGKAEGSGLGLHHAYTRVAAWGGRLEIRSEPGRGTTVAVEFPKTGGLDAILIDDDPLVRMNWTVAAKRAGKTLMAYPDAASFLKEAGDLPKGTSIYIDSDLGDGVKGEAAAKELLALGFTELRLATGHDPAAFPPLPHLKAIQGKEPPWPTA